MDVDELFAKLKPVLGKKADALWLAYRTEPDPRKKRWLEGYLRVMAAKTLEKSYEERRMLLEPPPKEAVSGDYPLGVVEYNGSLCPFCLRRDDLTNHVSVFGRSGSGKTNIGRLIIMNLLKDNQPFMVFDWKRNYRCLMGTDEGRDILLFTARSDVSPLRFNPLIPPPNLRCSVWSYIRELVSLLCATYFPNIQLLSVQGVEYLLLRAIDSLFSAGMKEVTFVDVYNALEWLKLAWREKDWKSSAVNCLYKLTTGPIGSVLNCRKAIPVDQLLEKPVILELDAVGSSKDKTFLTHSLLLWLYHYRLAQGVSRFRHLLLIEEAHHILHRKHQESAGEESVTDLILRQIRELGEGVVLMDQHPSLTSIPGIGNTYCTIALNLKSSHDISSILTAMLLTGKRDYPGRLPVGTGIVKMQVGHFKPFLVRFFPADHLKKANVTDEVVKERMRSYFDEAADIPPIQRVNCDIPPIPPDRRCPVEDDLGGISRDQVRVLLDVASYPVSGVAERYGRLSLSVSKGNSVKRKLLEDGFVRSQRISTGRGSAAILFLTHKGVQALRRFGHEVPDTPDANRYGGDRHRFWVQRISQLLRQKGYRVRIEHPIGGGKTVDVAAFMDDWKVAVEVETGNSDAVSNVRKSLDAEFDRVVSVLPDKAAVEALLSGLRSLNVDMEKVTAMTYRDVNDVD